MTQSAVEVFLSRPDTYSSAPDGVTRVETHGAVVFLAGDDAYKMKRAVHYPCMDFSTLERRHDICLRELELNRRAAPEIYVDVVPVTRESDGHLEFGGHGEPIEWLIHMKRFAQEDILGAVVGQGRFTFSLAREVADQIAAYHEAAPIVPAGEERQHAGDVLAQTSHALRASARVDGAVIDSFEEQGLVWAEKLHSTLEERANNGQVRRCHGDLHLQNIVVVDGEVRLFDAIEFNEKIARIDVYYDLAFLLMDLERNARDDAANWLFNQYLRATGYDGMHSALSVLPLFLACRAAVRSMVASWRGDQLTAQGDASGCEAAALEACGYLSQAVNYLSPSDAQLVAIGGISGTGKTTVARALAPGIGARPGAVHLRTDVERKAMFGMAETHRLDDTAYGDTVNELVYDRLLKKAESALRAGHSVILDGVYLSLANRGNVEQLAERLAVPFAGLWLCAAPQDAMARVRARQGDASDATPQVVASQFERNTGPIGWQALNSKPGVNETVAAAKIIVDDRLSKTV
jgi:hypothetical protein